MRFLLVSTIMIVLSHLTGSVLRDYESITTTLKSQMIILLEDFPQKKSHCFTFFNKPKRVFFLRFSRKLKDILISLSEQVVKTTKDELTKHDKAQIIIDNEQNIKDSIKAIGEHHVIEHAVFKLLCKLASCCCCFF